MRTTFVSSRRKAFVAAILALCFGGQLVSTYLTKAAHYPNMDFKVYFLTAQMIHADRHAPLYAGALGRFPLDVYAPAGSPIALQAARNHFSPVMFYIYPPLLADLLAPFSRLTFHTAERLWLALNLTLFLCSLFALASLIRLRRFSAEFAVLALVAICFHPVTLSFQLGQVTIVLFALWAFGLLAYDRGWILLSAALIALATALKLTPLVVVPLFLVWWDRRWLAGYFVALGSLVAAMALYNGPASLAQFLSVGASMRGGAPLFDNISISSLVAWIFLGRIFDHHTARAILPLHIPALALITDFVEGLFYLACLWIAWRRRHAERAERTAALAIFSVIALLVSPVSWTAGYTIALAPFVLQWEHWLRCSAPAWGRGALLAVTSLAFWFGGSVWGYRIPLPHLLDPVFDAIPIVAMALFCLIELASLRTLPPPQLNAVE